MESEEGSRSSITVRQYKLLSTLTEVTSGAGQRAKTNIGRFSVVGHSIMVGHGVVKRPGVARMARRSMVGCRLKVTSMPGQAGSKGFLAASGSEAEEVVDHS